MAAGIYNFTIEQGTTFIRIFKYKDSNGNPISVAGGGCESTEISVGLGDVNGELSINVLDILVIVNAIVGSEILTPSQFEAADMNFDGSANVVDIIAIAESPFFNNFSAKQFSFV